METEDTADVFGNERRQWPSRSLETIKRELAHYHRSDLEQAAVRALFVEREFGPPQDMMLFGGFCSLYALDEMRRSYIFGNFYSVILCGHALLESIMGGELILAGEDKCAEGGFYQIIQRCRALGWIDEPMFDALDRLRRMRVAYNHVHVGLNKKGHMSRLIENAADPYELVETDAAETVRTAVDYMRLRYPYMAPPLQPTA